MIRVPIHSPKSVLSLRHLPSWLLLCAAAGAVNAGAFLAAHRFVTHVTGTVTRTGMDFHDWTLMFEYASVVLLFVLGAMSAVLLVGRRREGEREGVIFALPLIATVALTVAVAAFGHAGAFGEFGGAEEEALDFVLLGALSFAMGLQNAAVASNTGMLVRTTHLTGPATDLGIHVATAILATGAPRLEALKGAGLRAGKILSFTAGAALMIPLAAELRFLAFLAPALLIAIATASSFVPRWSRVPVPSPT